ncbi:pentapeptide repeat-containing protein [Paenibacillus medicaginis]|uniref:Pentapeptide repeat-containing protein n=1 Tax=Paenibacillus medicaginis TaxID=1470560 RepID=A0ABV5BYR0_9BACL
MSDGHKYSEASLSISRNSLQADCESCFGLCCVALPFAASADFAVDKDAGQPCPNLQADFRCGVHDSLRERGFKGCTVFDCFGAGQKVTQFTYKGRDWRKKPGAAKQIFDVFLIMRQLHELLWYLKEALTLDAARPVHDKLRLALEQTEAFTHLDPDALMELDINKHRADVNTLLLQTSEWVRDDALRQHQPARRRKTYGRGADLVGAKLKDADLRGTNLRGAYLIAADLRNADLRGADLIGADFRDTDLRGADLSESFFLTQFQINAAIGDSSTKLPASLTRPAHWSVS